MNIDLARKIDYFAGVPICFILSVLNGIKNALCLNKRFSKNPKKILFIELSEMGSTVLAYSAMKKAKELFPQAELYFLIFEENKASISLPGIIAPKNILTIRRKNFFGLITDTLKLLRRFKIEKFDITIDLELFSRFTNILSYFSGAPQRSGFYKFEWEGLYKGTFQTHKVAYNSHMHITLNFLALVYALKAKNNSEPLLKQCLGTEPPYELPRIDFGKDKKEQIIKKLQEINPAINASKKIIILNPDAGKFLPIRAWPLEKYAALTKKLLDDKNVYVVIMGVKSARKQALEICQIVNDKRCIDFVGKTKFNEIIDLFNVAQMLITNDSGPAHFAALTPIKIVVFFGPETPKLYAPLSRNKKIIYSNFACSPCLSAFNHRKTPCKDNLCLKTISVDYVYGVVNNFLNNETASVM